MIEGEPSQTARMTALLRAHHFLTAPEPKILEDSVALPLSGAGTAETLLQQFGIVVDIFTDLSDKETAELFVLRTTHAVCMRSRVFEEQLISGVAQGAEQVIIFGAGLDTTAYRYATLLGDIPIYEIDHPATQKWKKATLEAANIAIPDNLHFVGIDFETQTLAQALNDAGVKKQKITVMSWLGVTMYLTDDSVKATLGVLGGFAKNSCLVLDFMMPDYDPSGEFASANVAHLSKVVSEMGEPMISKYSLKQLEDRLNHAGFGTVKFYQSKELADLYLDGQRELYGMPDDVFTLLAASI